jgi:exopolyphosphatase/pppGpp-phosphohydrolase
VTGEDPNIVRRYAAARAGVPDGEALTLLHIGQGQTLVATGAGAAPTATIALAVGARKTADEYFRHQPPTPAEMEQAILAVEDQVMRARALHDGGAQLVSNDAIVRQIARLAEVAEGEEVTVPIDAVEQVFERMAAIVLGRPASQDVVPADTAFAATLLILREFMHHLQFPAITSRH